MKLNLGCGFNKIKDYINVDSDSLCRPDIQHNLESFPWPFEDDSVDEVKATHVLEHLGESSKNWIQIWKEIWRVSKHGAVIEIVVPHPRHINFLIDPTHVRPVLPETIAMFDQMRNIRDFEAGGSETKLGLMNEIDLEVTEAGYDLEEPWASALNSGTFSREKIQQDLLNLNNVCFQIRMKARIIKPLRGTDWLKSFQGTKIPEQKVT